MSTKKEKTGKTGRKNRKRTLLVDHPAWADRLSTEWNWEKNDAEGIKPDEVTAGSARRVWWRCRRGHEWQAIVSSRVYGCGCPYCSGRLPIPGETDLATTMPELAREWHPTRNGNLTPQDVTKGSNKRVWWRCEHGHEWQTTVGSRTGGRGTGCPCCAKHHPLREEVDFATSMPELAREWHPTKNGDLTPRDVATCSSKRVWWICGHGHEWQAMVKNRAIGRGCPYCSGRLPIPGETDLATTMPELAKEWHPTKNGDLTPRDVMRGSGTKVWWRCACGHEWQAKIYNRAQGTGCPACSRGRRKKGGK